MLAIIGGTGLYDLGKKIRDVSIETPYGKCNCYEIEYNKKQLFFLPRHGTSHSVPPHKINYLANIYALQTLHVKTILSTAAAGAIRADFTPGYFGIVSQFIDFTKNRQSTFYDSFQDGIHHTDMTKPYSTRLNMLIASVLENLGYPFIRDMVLVVTEGPRFETPAEIKAYSILGADAVNMTNYPEVSLANELGMEYSTICISTNFAAGLSDKRLTHQEVEEMMKTSSRRIELIIGHCIDKLI